MNISNGPFKLRECNIKEIRKGIRLERNEIECLILLLFEWLRMKGK